MYAIESKYLRRRISICTQNIFWKDIKEYMSQAMEKAVIKIACQAIKLLVKDHRYDYMDENFVIEGKVQFEVFASETGRNNEDEDFFPFDDNPLVPYEAKYDKDE